MTTVRNQIKKILEKKNEFFLKYSFFFFFKQETKKTIVDLNKNIVTKETGLIINKYIFF